MSQKLKYAVLLLVLVQCFFWRLDAKPIHKIQELRVAETAREMVSNKDWLTPYFNGELRLRKPPLAYWVAAASYTVFGTVNEFSARFGSVCFSAATVFVLFFWLRKLEGPRVAFSVVAVSVSTYLGLRYSRNAETDGMLVFFICVACIQVYRLFFQDGGRAQVRWLYLFMALGFLTKGPAAIAIPLGVWLILAIHHKRYRTLRALRDPLGIALFLVVAFGWYAVMYFKVPNMLAHWVAEEIDATYISGKHQQPVYWYAQNIWKFYAPWSVFLPFAAVWLYRTRPHPPLVQWALAWFLLTFVLLTLNPSKQIHYALLLSPSIAILVGHYLVRATDSYAAVNRALFVLCGVGIAIMAAALTYKWRQSVTPVTVLAVLAGAVLPAALARVLRYGREAPYPQLLLAGIVASGTLYNQVNLYGEQSDRFEVEAKQFALAAKQYAPLYSYGAGDPILSFYANRVVPAIPDLARLAVLTSARPEVYIAVEHDAPTWPAGMLAAQVLTEGKYALWRLSATPALNVKVDHRGP